MKKKIDPKILEAANAYVGFPQEVKYPTSWIAYNIC